MTIPSRKKRKTPTKLLMMMENVDAGGISTGRWSLTEGRINGAAYHPMSS